MKTAVFSARFNKKIALSVAEEKVLDLLGGVPSNTTKIVASAGFNGGNAGICAAAASRYCFFPIKYRVEDGCYSHFSKYFLGEGAYYNPQKPNETNTLPVVFHNKKRDDTQKFYRNIVSEMRGSVIAQFLDSYLSSDGEKNALDITTATERAYKNYLVDFLKEKISSKNLSDEIMKFRTKIRQPF
ncbi:MAG: hypothetical protein V1817_01375, partial [Candidatus Micrarchaeota archaeon]